MATDPYAAPKSRVADKPARRAIETKPKEVHRAVWLLWLCIPIWIPASIYEYFRASVDARSAVAVGLALVVLVFLVLLYFINRGHNWARIAFLVITLLSFVAALGQFAELKDYSLVYLGLNIVLLLIDALVIYLLFTRPGSLWFKRVSGASASDEPSPG